MRGTRGMLQSSSNPCLRQYPFISLPSFVRLQISFSTLNMHANGGFKINWADFVQVYNLVPRILWILWLRNCTFSTFLIEHSPQFTPFIKFIKSCSTESEGNEFLSHSNIFCIHVKKVYWNCMMSQQNVCIETSKWPEHLLTL